MNEGGNKRSSPPAEEMLVKRKLKTSSTARDGLPAAERIASTIADRIAHRRGFVVPPMPKFVPRRSLGVKSGSPLERLAVMKSDKVDSTAKVALRPTPSTVETD
ncbi:hypothetical protein ACFX15_037117 [Malus domestica]